MASVWAGAYAGLAQCMVSQNGMLIMGTDKAHVLRVHQDHHQDLEDIPDLSKRETDRIHAVYEDPTGGHVLISMATGDNYYLHESWKKPKPIPKMKDVVVSSIVRRVVRAVWAAALVS